MKELTIALSSVTMANKALEAVQGAGIHARITRLLPEMTKKGCAFGLTVSGGTHTEAELAQLMRQNKIRYSEILSSEMHRHRTEYK